MNKIEQQLKSVSQQIHTAEKKHQRPEGCVTLLAVSKTWPAEHIKAAVKAGQRCFGENYLQEAVSKIIEVNKDPAMPKLEWHYIGSIQSNKTHDIAQHFDWVHSIDRLKIAQRLNDQRPDNLEPLNVCLQINISGEQTKSGAHSDEILPLAQAITKLPRLKLRGLMAIPAPADNFQQQRDIFHRVSTLQTQLINQGLQLDTLSMGMSNDMEAAIAEGSTMVRVGTAIFGARHYPKQ
jgi:pyridoxal phosphate enzyme (YggS family)